MLGLLVPRVRARSARVSRPNALQCGFSVVGELKDGAKALLSSVGRVNRNFGMHEMADALALLSVKQSQYPLSIVRF